MPGGAWRGAGAQRRRSARGGRGRGVELRRRRRRQAQPRPEGERRTSGFGAAFTPSPRGRRRGCRERWAPRGRAAGESRAGFWSQQRGLLVEDATRRVPPIWGQRDGVCQGAVARRRSPAGCRRGRGVELRRRRRRQAQPRPEGERQTGRLGAAFPSSPRGRRAGTRGQHRWLHAERIAGGSRAEFWDQRRWLHAEDAARRALPTGGQRGAAWCPRGRLCSSQADPEGPLGGRVACSRRIFSGRVVPPRQSESVAVLTGAGSDRWRRSLRRAPARAASPEPGGRARGRGCSAPVAASRGRRAGPRGERRPDVLG